MIRKPRLARVSILAVLAASCQGGMVPGVETSLGESEVADEVWGEVPAVVEPTIPVFDPAKPRSPEEVAAHVAKIKGGEDFVALSLLPDVRVASQKVSDEIVLVAGTGAMRVPLAGNEGLLELVPGEVLAGNRASGKGDGHAGVNPFGFARKVVSTRVEGGEIVVETDPARLTDLFAGAVQVGFDLTTATPIDTTGIDLADWFADWGEGYGPPQGKVEGALVDKVTGAWGIDFTYTGDWGVKDKREFKVAVEQAVKGITLVAEGTLGLDVAVGFMPLISFGFDVHTPIDVWNSYVNYIKFKAGGTFYADAVVDAVLTIAAKASVSAAQLASAKDSVKKGMPMPAAKSPKFKLGMLGPFAGPSLGPVPTTFLVEFVAGCEVTVYATIKAQAEGHVKANASFGFEYDHATDKLSFPLESGFEKSTKFTFQSGEGGVVAECTFGPRVQWKIADIGGPYIDGHAGAIAELTYAAECKPPEKTPKSGPPPATLSGLVKAGFVIAFGGAIEIGKWGVTLWEHDFGTVDLVNEWWPLWSQTWSVGDGLGKCESACEDGVRNYSEGGVDCGGYYCPKKCPEGSTCNMQSDCPPPLNCTYGKCSTLNQFDPCNDGKLGPGEIDTDCGGKCPKCKLGQKCNDNEDCLSGLCPKMFGYTCATFNCQNGVRDPAGETDVDCGGECAKYSLYCSPMSHCLTDNDCATSDCVLLGSKDAKDKLVDVPTDDAGLIELQRCMPKACVGMDNGVQDNDETDVDCGGSCIDAYDPPSKGSTKIKNAADLTEAERNAGYQTKTGTGKDFFRCRHLQGCAKDRDCLSGYCHPTTHLCEIPPCANQFKDFGEGDVDCGGPCLAKCAFGKTCAKESDCKSDGSFYNPVACTNWNVDVPGQFAGQKVCKPFWEDGVWQSWVESDVDCGDKAPNKCGAGKRCGRPEWCEAGLACTPDPFGGATCRVPGTCSDKKVTDRETDVDCGGECYEWDVGCVKCGPCSDGKACASDTDCKSKKCDGFVKLVYDAKSGAWVKGTYGTCRGTCGNGVIDAAEGEGDIDCGGPKCPDKCCDNCACKSNDQCRSGFCVAGRCAVAACDDGVASGTESDIDCGGTCAARCAKGKKCAVPADCVSGVCTNKVCQAGKCDNGLLDAGEAGVDCGAACSAGCKLGTACSTPADCASGTCSAGACACGPGKRPDAATGKCTACLCSPIGAAGADCDASGACACKPGWGGPRCEAYTDPCEPGQCPAAACANPSFANPWILATESPADSVAADFDGDQVLDLAVASGNPSSVLVFRGKGPAGFRPPTTWGTGPFPGGIAAGDLNGDGRIDLVTANWGESWSAKDATISVLLGNGDGTFKPKLDAAVGGNSVRVEIADLDGDGKLDVVAANDTSAGVVKGAVSVLLGKGDGTFKPRTDLAAAAPMRVGDVNGDGRADVVANALNGKLCVLIGNGNGTFQPRQDLAFAISEFTLADLNGDGRADLLRADDVLLRLHLAAASGVPYAGPGTSVALPSWPRRIVAGDLDGDGLTDVLANYPGGFAVIPGKAGGALGTPVPFATAVDERRAAIGDFDGNGRPDLVQSSTPQRETTVVRNPGAPGFHLDTTGLAPRSLLSADLNADGVPDLVTANEKGDSVSVLLGGAGGTYAARKDYATGQRPTAVAAGDLNGDGKPDLAVTYAAGSTGAWPWAPKGGLSLLFGNGDGTFQARKDVQGDVALSHVAIGDLNGDGRPDLAVTVVKGDPGLVVPGADRVRVLPNDGTGTFPAHAAYRTDGQPSFVAVADLDLDGRPDLAVASRHGGTVNVLLNKGDGTFKDSLDAAVAPYPAAIGVGDFDLDGRPDLAVASGHSFTVGVLLGRGDGTFRWRTDVAWANLGAAFSDAALAVLDANRDGRPDLALSRQGWKELVVLTGTGDGTFKPPLAFRAAGGRNAIQVLDVNADAYPDLVTLDGGAGMVRVMAGSCQDANLCENGKIDPGESDVDCGAGCGAKRCAVGRKCGSGADCASLLCLGGACADNPCGDGKKAGAETDVDCGGGCPTKCALGKGCLTAKDCASGFCDGLACVATACEDRLKSAGEADIDCGGSCAAKCATGKKCSAPADCASGFCDGTTCVATACQDKKASPGEGGIDCGGTCPLKCALGALCKAGSDCASGSCDGFVCVVSPCQDKKRNGTETDVDCGGSCPAKCSTGKACAAGADCASGVCSASKRCVTSTCDDGILSGSESDVDCGGSCATDCVPGAKCAVDADCISGLCSAISKVCATSACFDQKLDGDETDIDCGGSCLIDCPLGLKCKADADCASEACGHVSRVCVASWCLNERKDGDETDLDCGGSCKTGCGPGRGCKADGDCLSALCASVAKVCVTTHCQDQRKDGDETDLDCGGSCAADCTNGQGCATGADCASGWCSVAGRCVATNCTDGRVSGDETDTDCGGACPLDCATGKRCGAAVDCVSGHCSVAGLCVATSCDDGRVSGDETDIDCGGSCTAKCANGHACGAGTDCASAVCSVGGRCVATTCEDGRKNGTETDIDCGGSCPIDCATGKACLADGDCVSALCASVAKTCVATTCLDQRKDGDETDVDCGGSCAADCGLGLACLAGGDCLSGVCSVAGKCVASTCQDGRLSGDETDTDCGGSCAADCDLGEGCRFDSDCASASCAAISGVCVTGACLDERKNGDETDVDCGGSCPADCGLGRGCAAASDCTSGICSAAGACVSTTCEDGRKNGTETDIDCGGSCPSDCAAGRACLGDGDCQSGLCASTSKVCVVTTCQDERKDGTETDVDCGGSCAADCGLGAACLAGGDCMTGVCSVAGRCVATTCVDGRLSGDETDTDCGGSCAADCDLGEGCRFDSDCSSASCAAISGVCVTGACLDERRDGDETDVDCGGSCPADCGLGRGCAAAADCASGICSAADACVATTCEDGRRNGDETDVDCGGSCPLDCVAGRACLGDGDCQSTLCATVSKVCVVTTCQDERKDGTETDVDCGGSCPADCANGGGCTGSFDCLSGICSVGGLCVGSYCEDGRKNGTETDVDCGGACAATCGLDAACTTGTDCASAVCSVALRCVATPCSDGRVSGDETDVDCGGSCAADCATGRQCRVDGDCVSTFCGVVSKQCVADACLNQKQDPGETDVDCGGACAAKCAIGAGCIAGADCASGVCSVSAVCVATTCEDGRLSGDETGVDCGGSCPASCDPCAGVVCQALDACHVAGVCNPATGVCSNPPKPDGTTCNDNSACTSADACKAGVCTGTAVVCVSKGQCQIAGTCNPATGTCSASTDKPNGTTCDDDNACTQTDTCQSGWCFGSNPLPCTAPLQCNDGACSAGGLNVGGAQTVYGGTVPLYIVPPGNLLANGGAEARTATGWTVVNGGSGWTYVTKAPPMPNNPGSATFGAASFVSSYGSGSLEQTVDLVAAGYAPVELDAGLQLRVGAFGRGYGAKGLDKLKLDVTYLDGTGVPLGSMWTSGTLSMQWDMFDTQAGPAIWVAPYLDTTTYPVGTRKVRVKLTSQDGEFWAGSWGAVIDGISVVMGAIEMRLSNDGGAWTAWQPYTPVVSAWTLPPGDGIRTVHVEFRDGAGAAIGSATDRVRVRQCLNQGTCDAANVYCGNSFKANGTACDQGVCTGGVCIPW